MDPSSNSMHDNVHADPETSSDQTPHQPSSQLHMGLIKPMVSLLFQLTALYSMGPSTVALP